MSMKYLKDPDGHVHGFDISDQKQAELMVLIASDWIDVTNHWPPVVANAHPRIGEIKAELLAIDAKTPRAMRESVVTGDTSRLVELEARAEKLRAELADLI
ncbi:hypothetical protein [uncultured Aquabacterium sp.]|uniref:hypothetical protein n=1 Tax=uncultured Aquabacterium sp. TaxID=158753 RepID=UPI0025E45BE7|nr:hypothetical protein [uncultured Aquabacterium sp.]